MLSDISRFFFCVWNRSLSFFFLKNKICSPIEISNQFLSLVFRSWKSEYNNLNKNSLILRIVDGIAGTKMIQRIFLRRENENLITGKISMIILIHELWKKKNYICKINVSILIVLIIFIIWKWINFRMEAFPNNFFSLSFSLFHPLKHKRPFHVLQRRLCGHYARSLL